MLENSHNKTVYILYTVFFLVIMLCPTTLYITRHIIVHYHNRKRNKIKKNQYYILIKTINMDKCTQH